MKKDLFVGILFMLLTLPMCIVGVAFRAIYALLKFIWMLPKYYINFVDNMEYLNSKEYKSFKGGFKH